MGRGRVEQGGDNSRLVPVQPLKAVDARIGRAQLGPPQPAANSLQGGEHLIEDAANVETTLSMSPRQTALGANTTSRLNG